MTMKFKIEDFGNGFRAFCYGPDGFGLFTIGALVSKDHPLSQIPYFIAERVCEFVDENNDYLYRAYLLHTLFNGTLDYGSRLEVFRVYDRPFLVTKMGMTENDFLWQRSVTGTCLQDALEEHWPSIEAEAKALASITRDELLEQAERTFRGPNHNRCQAHDLDWVGALRKSEALHAAELKACEDRIRYLEDRVVELKGRI